MNLSNVILLNVAAAKPGAGVAGRLFFASDTLKVYRDDGALWVDATPAAPPASIILAGAYAARPAFSTAGRLYFATDTLKVYRDSGAAWVDVTPAAPLSTAVLLDVVGSRPAAGTEGRLFFASDTLRVFRDNGATWDDVTPASVGGVQSYSVAITAETEVTVTHSLGTVSVIVQVFDGDGLQVLPETCTIVDVDTVALTFGAAFTGKVVVLG